MLFCKFQPAFNTSPTVAALFGFTSLAPLPNVGAACSVVGAVVSFLAPTRLPATFVKVAGVVVPSGPFTEVITSVPGTTASFGPSPFGVVWYVTEPSSAFTGYTFVPSAFVYATGDSEEPAPAVAFLSTSTVIVRTPLASVLPETIAPPLPTNFTSFAFFTVAE